MQLFVQINLLIRTMFRFGWVCELENAGCSDFGGKNNPLTHKITNVWIFRVVNVRIRDGWVGQVKCEQCLHFVQFVPKIVWSLKCNNFYHPSIKMFVGSIPKTPKSLHDPSGSNLVMRVLILQLHQPHSGRLGFPPTPSGIIIWNKVKPSTYIQILKGRFRFFPNSHFLPSPYLNFRARDVAFIMLRLYNGRNGIFKGTVSKKITPMSWCSILMWAIWHSLAIAYWYIIVNC